MSASAQIRWLIDTPRAPALRQQDLRACHSVNARRVAYSRPTYLRMGNLAFRCRATDNAALGTADMVKQALDVSKAAPIVTDR
jgi:hypothetical protein